MTVTELQRVLIDLQTRLMYSHSELEKWSIETGDRSTPDAHNAYVLANGLLSTSLEKVTALIKDLKV